MSINYTLITKTNKYPYVCEACFSNLKYLKDETRTTAEYVVYKPACEKLPKETALKYLCFLLKLPFFVCSTPAKEILTSGARVSASIPFENMLSTLSAVRYVQEKHSIVNSFINLREKEHLPLQIAFFYAHFISENKVYRESNTGHMLFDTYDTSYPDIPIKYNYALVHNLMSKPWNTSIEYGGHIWNLYDKYRKNKIDTTDMNYKELLAQARRYKA